MSDIQISCTQQGWECPKCGRVYSPSTPMCIFCGAEEKTFTTTTSDGSSISIATLNENKVFKAEEDKDE